MSITTANDLSGTQSLCMFSVLTYFVGPPEKFNGWRFPIKIGFSESNIYFVKSTTVWWYVTLIYSTVCAHKDISVDALSTSFSLHNYVALLYRNSISHSHIIIYVWCHFMNWYCNSSAQHMCTTWGVLASYSNIFAFH